MHHIFKIPEILSVIATFVCRRTRGYKDLLSLAVTNRSISEVALDILWEDQIYLDILLECFPVDLWDADGLRSRRFIKGAFVRFFLSLTTIDDRTIRDIRVSRDR